VDQTRGTLILLSRVPREGETKTRLAADTDVRVACAFHLASLRDLLTTFVAAPVARRVLAWADAPRPQDKTPMIPAGWSSLIQSAGDLGARMTAVARRIAGAGPAIFIGADAPTLPLSSVRSALQLLSDGRDAVFQPARDGGYVLAAFRGPPGPLVHDIPWGTEDVLQATLDRAAASGRTVGLLDPWYDVDTGADLISLRRELQSSEGNVPATRRFLSDLETQ